MSTAASRRDESDDSPEMGGRLAHVGTEGEGPVKDDAKVFNLVLALNDTIIQGQGRLYAKALELDFS